MTPAARVGGGARLRRATSIGVRRALVVAAAVVVVLVVAVVGVAVVGVAASGPVRDVAAAPTTRAAVSVPPPDAAADVATLQRLVAAAPTNPVLWRDLARAALQQAAQTANPSWYSTASAALERALQLGRDDPDALVIRSQLRLTLHDFAGARDDARRVLARRPHDFDAAVSLTDASVELGEYRAAEELAQQLVEQRPGVASLSRLSYVRQLAGDLLGAEAAMRSAVSSVPERSFERAVALGYLGELLLERGRSDAAERCFREALALHRRSSVAAIGLAHVLAARGETNAAMKVLSALIDQTPAPAAIGLRAEIERVRGDRIAAAADDQLVDASIALLQANGAVVDAELALLLAARDDADPRAAVAAAARAYRTRRTVFTADARAWTLYRSGDASAAAAFAREAVATKVGVASIHLHAAVIFDAVGARDDARRELALANRNTALAPSQQPLAAALTRRLGVTP